MQVGPYRVTGTLGEGGQGRVLAAEGPTGPVVLKTVRTTTDLPRLLEEARLLARLRHPGIVAVHDVIQDPAGRPLLVLERVEGGSLQERLVQSGPLRVPELLEVALQLCEALGHAHARGVLHRDLKPANVLRPSDGRIRLTDFGLGLGSDRAAQRLTATGEVLGTPGYLAPEQIEGKDAAQGTACDVYGLGATCYALLTGQPPFQGASLVETLHRVVHDPPRPASRLRPDLPPALEAVVMRCLAKEPAARYPDMEALAGALRECQRAPRRRTTRLLAPSLAALLLAGGVAGGLALVPQPAPSPSPAAPRPAPPRPAPPAEQPPTPLASASDEGWEARFGAATALLDSDPAAALTALEQLGRERPNEPIAPLNQAVALGRLGRVASAREACDRALAMDPSQAHAWYNRALYSRELGETAQALRDVERCLQLAPSSQEALTLRGDLRGSLGDSSGALADLDRVIATRDAPRARCVRAMVHKARGDAVRALQDLDAALRLAPDLFEARVSRGLLLAAQGQPERGLEDLEAALRVRPDDSTLIYNRGLARMDCGDHAGALADLNRAAEQLPNDLQVLSSRGRLYLGQGDGARAQADFERALALGGEVAVGLYLLGEALALQDDLPGAERAWRRAAELEPAGTELAELLRGRLERLRSESGGPGR